tara:strand:- start:1550 stop:2767 length:1218 start_codon:yes stop_codon:yes gene_type:complete
MNDKKIKKIVLAYSGGLDTTVILHWLKNKYDADVITFTADIGQEQNEDLVRERANSIGASKVIIEDLRERFTKDFIFPMFKANAVYEGEYLLGTSIARPLISERLVEIAEAEGADAIAHGATGKGNDQIRFEIGSYSLNPDIKVLAPWRTWEYSSREELIDYCKVHQIDIDASPEEPLYSTDENLLHTSYEGEILEDPSVKAPDNIWKRTAALEDTPDTEDIINLEFEKGEPVGINDIDYSPSEILEKLNELAGKHGIGRLDLVENRFTGMKSRGCYETPGGTILLKAHRAIESITLDSKAGHLKDELMPKYAQLIYDGFWWSPEREAIQALIDKTQEHVSGSVQLSLFKGNISVLGRSSKYSLYDPKIVTFEDDENAYDQADATGFIKINSLRLKQIAKRKRKS